jgi:arsenite methyltransferase
MEKAKTCCGPECCAEEVETKETVKTEAESGEALKRAVREHYAALAESGVEGCGCGSGCGSGIAINDDYSGVEGHAPEADLALGCGLPTEAAAIRRGETVVDLGSGAGNDAFVARALVGAEGRVIGVDMTEAMIAKAKSNNARLGYSNVEFRFGDIEDLPLRDGAADVVISNCVLNLVPDKARAFSEAHRVLKQGGRLAVSDVVVDGPLPAALRGAAEAYVGCISGALEKEEYLRALARAGFTGARIVKEKEIALPEDLTDRYLGRDGTAMLRESGVRIMSVTVKAEKLRADKN